MVEYEFDKEKCWYKLVCKKYNTRDCNLSCIRYMEIFYLMVNSNIPKKRQIKISLTPDDCDKANFDTLKSIKEDIDNFVNKGNNLLIYSNTAGNGKTSWAFKLMTSYFDKIWLGNCFRVRGVYYLMSDLFELLVSQFDKKHEDSQDKIELLKTCDLVIFDDIASTKFSDYRAEKLFAIIESRLNNGKSCIFTSNLSSNELGQVMDKRLVSRIWNESIIIEFKGKDKRGMN